MKFAIIAFAAVLLPSCGGMHWTERAAQDRIMLVREQPITLGQRRLVYQSSVHPDLGKFLSKSGSPDFIAETSSDNRQYLILYYLDSRTAYACRSWRDQLEGVEFAGPYPMTDKETDLLNELKSNAVQETKTGIASGRLLVP